VRHILVFKAQYRIDLKSTPNCQIAMLRPEVGVEVLRPLLRRNPLRESEARSRGIAPRS
jgi:hypothetical protein